MKITKGDSVIDGKPYSGWVWTLRRGAYSDRRVASRTYKNPDDGRQQALGFALKLLTGEDFDPLMMVATKSVSISDGVSKPRRHDDLDTMNPSF